MKKNPGGIVALILTVLLAIFLSACGSGGGGGGGDDSNRKSVVTYELDSSGCLVSASDYDKFSESEDDDGFKSRHFLWYCASYKGQSNIYVSLDFYSSYDNFDCLTLDREYISDGIC